MKINRTKSLFALAALAPMAIPAFADIQYTQETTVAGQNNGQPFSTTKISRRKGAERSEMTYKIANYEQKTITITSCALKQTLTLDPNLKIYYSTPLTPGSKDEGCGVGTPVKKGAKNGTMTTTIVSVKPLGAQKVGSSMADAYEVVIRVQMDGCLGTADSTTKHQFFVGKNVSLGDGDLGCTTMVAGCGGGSGNDCNIKYVRKGNWAAYNKITKGLSLRTRIFTKAGDPKWQSELQVKDISRAPLSPALFTIPAGYKKVSDTQFVQLQGEAMTKRMMAGNN